MIENTFLLLPGVGPKTEQGIWRQGIMDWNSFLEAGKVKGISRGKKLLCDQQLLTARRALQTDSSSYFAKRLPGSEHWRLYDYFKDDAVFLDIETCGGYGYITVIGLYDSREVKHMVRGANLTKELLAEELSKYKLLVTFNGSSSDLPVINRYFKEIVPGLPHLDLRHICARLGFNGGLKMVEKQLNIKRESDVDGMAGGDAVILWDKFRVMEDEKYLDLLLKYNEEDIVNLRPIADFAVAEMSKRLLQSSL